MKRRVLRRQLVAICISVLFIVLFSGKFVLDTNNRTELPAVYMELRYVNKIGKVTAPSTPRRLVDIVNCAAIIANDTAEIKRATNISMSEGFDRHAISDQKYIELTRSCNRFKELRGYNSYKVTREETEFPLAFSILLYKEVEQAERLLRAIYRPQNHYCFHVDADAAPDVHKAVDGIADCFPNVFVVSRKEYIVYAGYSRLQADLNCMENLLQAGRSWRYFMNLPSQQFPIKTNAELVKILKIYNGSNDIEGITGGRMLSSRIQWRYHYKHTNDRKKPQIFKTNQKKGEPPFNITIVKGSAYGVFSRPMVDYIIHDRHARALLDYLRDVLSPDEYYWATLNHNPQIGVPGAYTGEPDKKPWLATYAAWVSPDNCAGKVVRGVCVFGVGDIGGLVSMKYLFVNKFYLDYQPLALDCMEEWYFNRTFGISGQELDLSFYRSLPFIQK